MMVSPREFFMRQYMLLTSFSLYASFLSAHPSMLYDVQKKTNIECSIDVTDISNQVNLTKDETATLKKCLSKDFQACKDFLHQLQKKAIANAELIDEAAQNGNRLKQTLEDTTITPAEKKELLITYQEKADHYLHQLNSIISEACFLYYFYEFAYFCRKNYGDGRAFQDAHRESCYRHSHFTDIVMIDKQGNFSSIPFNDALRLDSVVHAKDALTNKNLTSSTQRMHFLTDKDFVTPPPGQILFPDRSEYPSDVSDRAANIYSYEANTWNGKRGNDSQQFQSDLKVLCARSGLFAEALKYIYQRRISELAAAIQALINELEKNKDSIH